jgi:hypothetical protein
LVWLLAPSRGDTKITKCAQSSGHPELGSGSIWQEKWMLKRVQHDGLKKVSLDKHRTGFTGLTRGGGPCLGRDSA